MRMRMRVCQFNGRKYSDCKVKCVDGRGSASCYSNCVDGDSDCGSDCWQRLVVILWVVFVLKYEIFIWVFSFMMRIKCAEGRKQKAEKSGRKKSTIQRWRTCESWQTVAGSAGRCVRAEWPSLWASYSLKARYCAHPNHTPSKCQTFIINTYTRQRFFIYIYISLSFFVLLGKIIIF